MCKHKMKHLIQNNEIPEDFYFLLVLRFPPPLKLTREYENINMCKHKMKHNEISEDFYTPNNI